MRVVQGGNDGAVGKWEFAGTVGVDRNIIPQDGGETVQVTLFVGDRDNFQSRYPGGIVMPKMGTASPEDCGDTVVAKAITRRTVQTKKVGKGSNAWSVS